ncbi:hypothetical protein M409DRAFT_24664 [Zasmidium cellare ATCC 36951]|uniref:DUF1772 domain-containing protein n=1 Tax=Zasmidium cellare ATCC 36951 TaxID=1080233 RepID=A0A6A6CGG0_ZASCE|nr:uncharacterized protein M409DRAFT_24664 [Zasmidium cellare ATCC 36951]KAF2164759.1 hypothetical protein M409DRAFT_24664 [Zasmidium cellare ATCC 36951]
MASKHLTQASIFLAPATSLFMAGYSFAASQNTLPHLFALRPQTSIPIFTRVFHDGGKIAIPASLISGLMSLYVALWCTSSRQRVLFTLAGLCAWATAPWTGFVMWPGIKRLMEMEGDERAMEKSEQTLEHVQLLRAWVRGNWVRTGAYAVSGGLGLWAAVWG